MKIYLSREVSKKSGNEYIQMYAQTGSNNEIITMDKDLMLNLLDVSPSKLNSIIPSKFSTPVYVADFNLVKEGNK